MTAATAGLAAGLLFAGQIGDLVGVPDDDLVRAAFVGVWAQMNYEQLTALFRVEERSVAFVCATLVNLLVTVGATVILVVGLDQGPLGVIVGNWIGTLVVYLGLLGYRREQLGLQFDTAALPPHGAIRLAARAVRARAHLHPVREPPLPLALLGPARGGPVRARRCGSPRRWCCC